MTFPPHRAIGLEGNIGVNRVFLNHLHGVSVGLRAGSRHHAKKPRFWIDRPKPTVRTDPEPCDVLAHGKDPPALHRAGRDQHRKIGLAAGARKGAANISDLAIGAFNSDDEHVLGQPSLLLS